MKSITRCSVGTLLQDICHEKYTIKKGLKQGFPIFLRGCHIVILSNESNYSYRLLYY